MVLELQAIHYTGLDIMARISEYLQTYKATTPVGFWLGSQFIILIKDPQDAEIVINHPSSMHKGALYQVAIDTMGAPGLLTASGIYFFISIFFCEM